MIAGYLSGYESHECVIRAIKLRNTDFVFSMIFQWLISLTWSLLSGCISDDFFDTGYTVNISSGYHLLNIYHGIVCVSNI